MKAHFNAAWWYAPPKVQIPNMESAEVSRLRPIDHRSGNLTGQEPASDRDSHWRSPANQGQGAFGRRLHWKTHLEGQRLCQLQGPRRGKEDLNQVWIAPLNQAAVVKVENGRAAR
jgi:hypothetical protein